MAGKNNKEIEEQRKRYKQIKDSADRIFSKINDTKYSLQNMEYQINRATESLKNIIDNP